MKISQKQFLQEVNGKPMALIGVPSATWNALIIDSEEKLSEWLYLAENKIDISSLCKADYTICTTTKSRLYRGDSCLDVKGFTIYKTADNKYILAQLYEDSKFEEFSIKLIIYHCREKW